MLNKELQLPIKIEKLQALLRRLPPHHEQLSIIKADLAKYTAGVYGEDAVQYYFNFIEKEKYTIMRDVRLTFDQNIFFQIDYLLLSANFFLILEVKNISGTLTFDSSLNQMTRISDLKEEGFPDPILQVRRQHHQLSSWFQKMKIKSPPIHSLVVISYPSTIIKTSSNESKKYVIHAASLPDKIHQYESIHIKQILTTKEIAQIKRKILKNNKPVNFSPIEKYKLLLNEVQTGIHCPNCTKLPMIRIHAYWYCPYCKTQDKNAHLVALKDYALVVSNTISNKELRDFLHLPSMYVASRMLKDLHLESFGRGKGTRYKLPF